MGNICCQSAPPRGSVDATGASNSSVAGSSSPTADSIDQATTQNSKKSKKNQNQKQKPYPIPSTDLEDEKTHPSPSPRGDPNTTNDSTQDNNTNSDPTLSDPNMARAVNNPNNYEESDNDVLARSGTNLDLGNEALPQLEGNINAKRFLIYKPHIIQSIQSGGNTETNIVKVEARLPDNCEEKDDIVERIIVTYGSGGDGDSTSKKDIELACSICMDDEMTPSQLIEYTFDNQKWYLANICPDCLGYYRSNKFENWKNTIENETCEAALRRLTNIGPITSMFDNVVFASPEDEKHLYQVKDHNGKTVTIPRPVTSMRIWDPSKSKYKSVRARLDGVPESEEELQEMWHAMLDKLKTKYGADIVNGWMNASTPGGPDEFAE